MPIRPPSLRASPRRTAVVRYTQNKPKEASRQHRRNLSTSSGAWRSLRAQVLREEPLCRICAGRGRVKAACQVDHIDGDARNDERSNLQALCGPCHSRKTCIENGGFGNRPKVDTSRP